MSWGQYLIYVAIETEAANDEQAKATISTAIRNEFGSQGWAIVDSATRRTQQLEWALSAIRRVAEEGAALNAPQSQHLTALRSIREIAWAVAQEEGTT